MIRVGVVAELLEAYTAALSMMTEHLLPPPPPRRWRSARFDGLINTIRLVSRPASTPDSASSFYLYF
ncbi:hypothetical protein ACE6H2_009264 [Prunus campanulata]